MRGLCLFLLVFFSGNLFAQSTGQLTGSVVDPTGASVPGAQVSLLLPNAKAAALTTTATSEGLFTFSGVRPATYALQVEAKGFTTYRANGIVIDSLRTTSVPPVKLEIQATVQTLDVSGNVQAVETASTELATTVNQAQVEDLPVLDRQISNLFLTQAGVASSRTETVINGLRPSYANLTLDGINIQDNFIRTNGLDFLPNKLTISQVQQLTVATSNVNSTIGGGASQIVLVTPSGSNQTHGSLYWYNRNNALSANDWFNNQSGVPRPFLNLNEVGGNIGGHIIKDKLFYYGNYEAYRLKQTSPQLNLILTPSARQGIITYPVAGGKTQTFDVLKAQGLSIDPVTQNFLQQVPTAGNTTNIGDSLNTTGYQFNARSDETRDNVTARIDYNFSTKHIFSGTYIWNRDIVDRPDLGNFYTVVPPVYNDDNTKLLAVSWRWNPRSNLTNELRGGFNLSLGTFKDRNQYPQYIVSGLIFDTPQNSFLAQGRQTNTYHIQDNANYIRGRHNISFGFQSQMIRTAPYNDGGIIPAYGIGYYSNSTYGFSAGDIPGLPASFVGTANGLQSSLAGLVNTSSQTFNVTSRTSGFVSGATNLRHYTYNGYSGYVWDTWKVLPRLTLVLGMRYDYFPPADERDALALLPQIPSGSTFIQTLLSNATLNFAGNAVGRPFYHKDLNNFAPNIGLAWDVFGDGKTSFRAAYSIFYVNDDVLLQVVNDVGTNNGLFVNAGSSDFDGKLTGRLQPVAKPVFQVPLTFADNFAVNPNNAQGLPDPNLRTPYVQEWNVSIQRELKGFVLEGRYVGNHGTKEFRQFDYNQVNINASGFLDDFIRARSNGFLSAKAGLGFNPAYQGPGSQRLTVFPRMINGGFLTNSTVRGLIQTGQVGTLAQLYFQNSFNGPVDFFANPNGLGMNTIANYSNSTYDSLQLEVRKRTAGGIQLQANYTYGKVLTDASADTQGTNGFSPFLDIHNPALERSRATFDLRHAIKLNHVIPLPFGPGKRFSGGPVVNKLIGGWELGGFLTLQSGSPFSIVSGRGTLNRGSRSGNNTVITTDTGSQLSHIVKFEMTGNGPVYIDPSAIGSDGRGVAPDGAAPFQGQVFFNPGPGQVGSLQKLYFSGPWFNDYDFSILKDITITERHRAQFRADFFNLTNHPNFSVVNQPNGTLVDPNVNSASFGKITSMAGGPRVVQFGLRYRF